MRKDSIPKRKKDSMPTRRKGSMPRRRKDSMPRRRKGSMPTRNSIPPRKSPTMMMGWNLKTEILELPRR
jgi:hypothetical protein